jgi:hypothetical protein
MAKAKEKKPEVTKSASVVLDGGDVQLPAGSFTLTKEEPGPTPEDFANAAFAASRASFMRLMPEKYRLIVSFEDQKAAYGLTKWIKLIDHEKEDDERRRKQPLRRGKIAA